MSTAVVVGSGPNGLAAAIILARAGLKVTVVEGADQIGGGTRSSEMIVPGLLHDHCSAIHPMAVGSPFLRGLDLERYGLSWAWPEIDCAHPLDDGSAGALFRSVTRTATGLGSDDRAWRLLFERTTTGYDRMSADIMRPLLRPPRHPLQLARFGAPALAPATLLARLFRTEQARSLFGGVAAHAFHPLNRPLSASIGLGILTAGHTYGWAVAAGGSQRITDAMAALLGDLGGKIETGRYVRSVADLPQAEVTMWDVAPHALAEILGDRLPSRIEKAYRRFRYGPGAFKVDFAVDGGVPWTAEAARRAGTVHLGGSFAEIAATESEIHRGRMPERPFVLVGQQYLADPQRSAGNIHPIWAYAHVPHGYQGDATSAITAQIERFAPGFRDHIVGTEVCSTSEFAEYNPNYVGGNIMTGAKDIPQLVFGPRKTLNPYDVGIPGHYICSAATPPGPGAHGMCGANAAQRALRRLSYDNGSLPDNLDRTL
ncbi:NAD(P)/FAD-dependent oxidoreductase [Nocardia sp. CNY236]|uniref:phytoene desaturase family protein n=1 Tax=Nocardia sp. CNY236 TaxID=1169152 RepID=UPI000413C89E|nr:NAD(P)/FAD-dependent oxidoreductase [Nocardia sp. CNY236]